MVGPPSLTHRARPALGGVIAASSVVLIGTGIRTLVAVAAAGSMSAALAAPPGALTGLRVAVSGLVMVTAVALAARVMVILERARRRGGR